MAQANQTPQFRGNLTTQLWDTMGVQTVDGTERHGQACYLEVSQPDSPESVRIIRGYDWPNTLEDVSEPCGPIDAVMQAILYYCIQCEGMEVTDSTYDGLRAGAGWIYGALAVAKAHGCTHANTGISSNDGNLFMVASNRQTGVTVMASHVTYYGT